VGLDKNDVNTFLQRDWVLKDYPVEGRSAALLGASLGENLLTIIEIDVTIMLSQ
jgi:hypothetical protein